MLTQLWDYSQSNGFLLPFHKHVLDKHFSACDEQKCFRLVSKTSTSKVCLSSNVCPGSQMHSILVKQNLKCLSSSACSFGKYLRFCLSSTMFVSSATTQTGGRQPILLCDKQNVCQFGHHTDMCLTNNFACDKKKCF